MKTKNYIYTILETEKQCLIFSAGNSGYYLGRVWIGKTGEWNVEYSKNELGLPFVDYLPINSALKLLGYVPAQNHNIE